MFRSIAIASISLVVLTTIGGCGDLAEHPHDGHHQSTGLEAPTNLEAMPMEGGVHLTWTDNSSEEEMFMLMRLGSSPSDGWINIGSTRTNITQFHDTTVARGKTYVYTVHAVRGVVDSTPSNEVTVTIP